MSACGPVIMARAAERQVQLPGWGGVPGGKGRERRQWPRCITGPWERDLFVAPTLPSLAVRVLAPYTHTVPALVAASVTT